MNNKRYKHGLRGRLMLVVLLPIILLGITINVMGIFLISNQYTENIFNELKTSTDVLVSGMDLMVQGDYSFEGGVIKKGSTGIIGTDMFYEIKERNNVDTTIFWGDTRVLTTIEDSEGGYYIHTKADKDIAENVLKFNEECSVKNVEIGGSDYIGFYRPLINTDGTVVGMIFAGKEKTDYNAYVRSVIFWFTLYSVVAMLIASLICMQFCGKMEKDIAQLNKFLGNIEKGDLTERLSPSLRKRKDEIGEIGRHASKMRDEIKCLIEVDPLTSLNNRRSGVKKLNKLHEMGLKHTVVMCDIDHFKRFNDTYGHSAGDEVLVRISSMMNESVEGCGFAIRWGGEEFLLVYAMPFEQALEKVKALQAAIRSASFIFKDNRVSSTMTFGMKECDAKSDIESEINTADERLYYGKENGRDMIVTGDSEKQEQSGLGNDSM